MCPIVVGTTAAKGVAYIASNRRGPGICGYTKDDVNKVLVPATHLQRVQGNRELVQRSVLRPQMCQAELDIAHRLRPPSLLRSLLAEAEKRWQKPPAVWSVLVSMAHGSKQDAATAPDPLHLQVYVLLPTLLATMPSPSTGLNGQTACND